MGGGSLAKLYCTSRYNTAILRESREISLSTTLTLYCAVGGRRRKFNICLSLLIISDERDVEERTQRGSLRVCSSYTVPYIPRPPKKETLSRQSEEGRE